MKKNHFKRVTEEDQGTITAIAIAYKNVYRRNHKRIGRIFIALLSYAMRSNVFQLFHIKTTNFIVKIETFKKERDRGITDQLDVG